MTSSSGLRARSSRQWEIPSCMHPKHSCSVADLQTFAMHFCVNLRRCRRVLRIRLHLARTPSLLSITLVNMTSNVLTVSRSDRALLGTCRS